VINVDAQPRIVVATQGAEPFAENGFAAVVVLDMFTQSTSLSSSESLVRRGFSAALRAKVGAPIVITGDPGQRECQAITRWDSPWFAGRECLDRTQAHLPPATRVALLVGARHAVLEVAVKVQEIVSARLLGPIDGESSKAFLVVRRKEGNALSQALNQVMRSRSADPKNSFVKIQMDPRDF
jgi:primosomal protein N' (replication factor Y)